MLGRPPGRSLVAAGLAHSRQSFYVGFGKNGVGLFKRDWQTSELQRRTVAQAQLLQAEAQPADTYLENLCGQ